MTRPGVLAPALPSATATLAFLVFTVDLFLPERNKEWLAGLSVVSLVVVMVIAILMLRLARSSR